MIRSDDWISKLHYKELIKSKVEPKDFYLENGKMVMTEECHIKRGYCCGSECKECPFWPKYKKYNKNTN